MLESAWLQKKKIYTRIDRHNVSPANGIEQRGR